MSLLQVPNCCQIPNYGLHIQSFKPFAQRCQLYDQRTGNIGNDYEVFRKNAKIHWNAMTFYMQKASSAYSSGQNILGAYMLKKAKIHEELAIVADEKASMDIFIARNENPSQFATIDLHGQHINEALKYVQFYLAQFANTSSRDFRLLRVITGYGSTHGMGKVKDAVTRFLNEKGIEWREENRGCLVLLIPPDEL